MSECDACGACLVSQRTYQVDGLFVAHIVLPQRGEKVAQHSHAYEHLTFLANGAVRVHVAGKPDQDYTAPFGLTIAADTKHQFTALADNTVLLCIHNTTRTGSVEQAEAATVEELQ